jgi:hypothetical protein
MKYPEYMKYLKYLAVPLVAALIMAAQLAGLFLRGDLPGLKIESMGQAQSGQVQTEQDQMVQEKPTAFLDSLNRRAGVATLVQPEAAGPGEDGADILVIDLPFRADPDPKAVAGPFDEGLDAVRNRTVAGLQAVIGFNCLTGTENPRLAAELGAWTGAGLVRWVGLYLGDLSATDQLPPLILQAWEAASGRTWDHEGSGIVLHAPHDNTVVVLRRGVELDRKFLSVQGEAGGIQLDSLLGGYFAILPEPVDGSVMAAGSFGFLPAGRGVADSHGIPHSFPLVMKKAYGQGTVWTLAFDMLAAGSYRPGLGLYPAPGLEARRSLDEPADSHSRFTRLSVPIWRAISLAALEYAGQKARHETRVKGTSVQGTAGWLPASSFRAGTKYLERTDSSGTWEPWFVKGVNLGPATPGHWFTDPPTDETTYLGWLESMAGAGFDTIRLYTLLPPAFYRALVAWNLAAEHTNDGGKVLYLIQEIWPEEDAPGNDLGDPAYLQAYLEESDRTIDAVFGRADIAERQYRAWGQYRADTSPWLAAVLVGRELEPEEVMATAQTRPAETFTGQWFSVAPGHPVENVLARMADQAAIRIAEHGGQQIPIGFVSWPTLDLLDHPAEWTAGSDTAPFNDRASVDFKAISTRPGNEAGFFTAYHIYPNYPDFMIRSARYDLPGDESGMLRYAAYLEELLATQEGIPLLVAEFGLATGYGTAHVHPDGLNHGGLSEVSQATGLVDLYRTIAGSGAAGGVVFQWADEWAKKTWTTEAYMIPYDRNPLWHNTIDPEQNYGIMAWIPDSAVPGQTGQPPVSDTREPPVSDTREPPVSDTMEHTLVSWSDPAWLYIQLSGDGGKLSLSGQLILDLGLDLVPGRTGEYRLYPGGPLAPQGSEFVIRARMQDGQLQDADLLVYPGYNRGGGRLYPGASSIGGFTRILTLVNGMATTGEGRRFESIWENGSILPVGPTGLVTQQADGSLLFRLPWSRLNFSDPSQTRILLDPVRDSRAVLAHDSLDTVVIQDIGVWGHVRVPGQAPHAYLPGKDDTVRIPLKGWEDVQAQLRPKLAYKVLAGFLPGWKALEEVPALPIGMPDSMPKATR